MIITIHLIILLLLHIYIVAYSQCINSTDELEYVNDQLSISNTFRACIENIPDALLYPFYYNEQLVIRSSFGNLLIT